MIDALEKTQQFLLDALTPSLGGAYVVTRRVPKNFQNTHPLVVLDQETGTSQVAGGEVGSAVVLRCYGGAAGDSEARRIFRLAHDAMTLPGQQPNGIKQIFLGNDFPGPDDPDTGWPVHIGRFQVVLENTI